MDILRAVMILFGGPALVAFTVWLGRRKACPNFSYWVETEGAPIFGVVLMLILVLMVPIALIGFLFLAVFNRWMR